MLLTWPFTVPSVMCRSSAICRLVSPRAISPSTSRSRSVSVSSSRAAVPSAGLGRVRCSISLRCASGCSAGSPGGLADGLQQVGLQHVLQHVAGRAGLHRVQHVVVFGNEVSTTIRQAGCWARMRFSTSMPPIPGITRSSRITSGSSAAGHRHGRPARQAASPTRSRSATSLRRVRSPSRTMAWLSTSMRRIMMG